MRRSRTTIFVADDHTIMRDGLKMLLAARDDFVVIGEAGDGREAVRSIVEAKPDVVIMDIAMPDLNGIEATRHLQAKAPRSRVIVLSMHGTREHVFRALQAGACAYLLKQSAGDELAEAIDSICRGERYLSREITDLVVQDYVAAGSGAARDPLETLSDREHEVLHLLAQGCSNQDIAARLELSPKTIHTYRSRMMQKLGVRDTAGLIRFTLENGLTT